MLLNKNQFENWCSRISSICDIVDQMQKPRCTSQAQKLAAPLDTTEKTSPISL